ncbi:MAG: peptide-methionine (S)-S-oxide reductase, partial [Bacteroidales bacterium]|nr:peptide-methionine (S)-S-oxide reductase [Bacteroidales bacterium]
TRYRSGVYYSEPDDLPVIRECFKEVAAVLGTEPVTELLPLRCFYPAEEYHQDYLDKNPDGYCHLPLKAFRYLRLYQDLKLLLGDEPDGVARMANTAALIFERMHFFWVGFYRVDGQELVLGPFQGPSACQRIAYGRGVCGKAWENARTLIVPDVEEFPGHIACSSLSRSEIVVPVPVKQESAVPACTPASSASVRAVLDIDSTELSTFDTIDAAFLELIAKSV